MKAVGIVFVGVGIALLLFTLFRSFQGTASYISPIPETSGMKVFFVSPGK